MIARLQRLLVLSVLVAVAGWWWWSGQHGIDMTWRLVVGVLLLLPHVPVLATEFLLLALLGDPRPAQPVTPAGLIKAWAGEVLWGVQTFAWRQPFRSNAEPDHLPPGARGRLGVVLVHGFVCNRGVWNPWLRRLRALDLPFVAVNLEPAFGSIDAYVETIDQAVRRLTQSTGRPPLIVAHSMGGLATRCWLQRQDRGSLCAGLVTIGTPHHGTWLARFAFSRNGRQMRRDSRWLAALNASADRMADVPVTCYYGHCDNIVFPAATATLPSADNRHLAGVAHVHMLSSAVLFDDVISRLLAAPAPTITATAATSVVQSGAVATGPSVVEKHRSPASTVPGSMAGGDRNAS